MKLPKIILASQSPRRQQYLQLLNVDFAIQPAAIDETPHVNEAAKQFVLRMANEKAQAVKRLSNADLPILAADTVIDLDDKIIGKPSEQQEFLQIFQQMSGRSHWVHTAVAIIYRHEAWQVLTSTEVRFCEISQQQALDYWNTGEPADKAGGYGIQGIGAKFVKSINGSYSSVVGLPLYETQELLYQVARFIERSGG